MMRFHTYLAADALLPSRIQMAFTLAYHVIMVPLGVALPTYALLMNGIGIFKNDPVALRIARRWSVVMAVQFAVGAVTGTILSFEFGILWPRLMGRYGAALGLGFAIEGLAFFLEAIFIGIYLYGWTRLRPRTHFLLGLSLPPAGVLGTFSVLASNSFMQTPGGITLSSTGQLINVDVLGVLFTRSLGYEFWHFQFAAMEITWKTRSHNPEYIGGLINGAGQVNFGIAIPSFDSILIGLNPDSVAPGLTAAAADARPSIAEANITHLAFDLMVGLGSAGVVLMVWYFVVLLGRRRLPQSRWFYRTASLAGIGSYVAIESGWTTTEVGRQPWIVYNLMRVDDAVTTAPGSFVWAMLAVLLVVYAVIAIIFVTVLLGLVTRWRHEDERQLVRAP